MGLNKGPFVVSDTVSVVDPYDFKDPNVILVLEDPVLVLSVDVCVKQPQKTQVSLDSMAQFAVDGFGAADNTFEVTYEIQRNGTTIATINDEMDYQGANQGRHTNFLKFPIVDNNPSAGINTYDLVCTKVSGPSATFIGSRSLKATVFTL